MAEEMQAGISVEWIDTDEKPFDPAQTTTIFAELEPLEAEQSTYYTPTWTDFYSNYVLPPPVDYAKLPEFEAPKAELIINIETTAVKPWEARLICIGVMDPNIGRPEALNFIRESEQATIDDFLEWFEASGYTTLIGYNVSFDFRFIFAVCQKYRRTARNFVAADLVDLMQIQKQVREEYVFGYNPTGTLEDWSTYLFGTVPYAKQEQVWEWFRAGNVDEIVNFNTDKLTKAYFLWVLGKVVSGTIPEAEVLSRPSAPTAETPTGTNPGALSSTEDTISVTCPNCMQIQDMPKTAKVILCNVCGTSISHP